MDNVEIELNALRLLEQNPRLTQRELSCELGVSLGKAHYVLKALVDMGWVRLDNFRRENQKLGVEYSLTSRGIAEKARITRSFLDRKKAEYARLRDEIDKLACEVSRLDGA